MAGTCSRDGVLRRRAQPTSCAGRCHVCPADAGLPSAARQVAPWELGRRRRWPSPRFRNAVAERLLDRHVGASQHFSISGWTACEWLVIEQTNAPPISCASEKSRGCAISPRRACHGTARATAGCVASYTDGVGAAASVARAATVGTFLSVQLLVGKVIRVFRGGWGTRTRLGGVSNGLCKSC